MATTWLQKKNNAKSTITNNPLSAGGLSITLASSTGSLFPTTGATWLATIWDAVTYPDPSDDPNMEVVLIDSRSTDTLTVNSSGRGYAGTTGVEHATGSAIRLLIMKEHTDQYETAINTIEGDSTGGTFHTSTGHNHNGTNSRLLFTGANKMVEGSASVNQAQSTTTTYFTLSGIANEDSGWIVITAGGNQPADRVMKQTAYAYYKTGGTMNISAASATPITLNVSSDFSLTAVASSGDILIKITTAAFGAGAFKGNIHVRAGNLNTGMTIA